VFLGGAGGIVNGNPATAATTLLANQAEALMGCSVASAGDVDGDGYADVIVGAYGYDAGEVDEGAAFVFLGSAGGVASGNPATAAAVLQSNQMDAQMGWSVSGAGDVNGDGYADVIVAARLYDAGQPDEGAAFVFMGGPSGIASGNPTTAAATLQSNQNLVNLGYSVAGAGDVTGDGYADVIVGAYNYSAGSNSEGAAFIFLGGAGGIANGNPATAATTLESNQVNAQLGISVAGAGDVNADGYSDVIVGAFGFNAGEANEGAAFVFLGGPGGIPNGNRATATDTLQSNVMGARFGTSVAGAGDVNGDGHADVIVGARFYNGGLNNEGAAFLFLGTASGVNSTVSSRIESNQADAELGYSVAGAGDVNGDGYADVIVGAPNYDAGSNNEGAAFVFLGGTGGIDDSLAEAAATLEANQGAAFLGVSVAGAGDVNGDGYADVIVGAYFYDSGGPGSEGAAFVFLGGGLGGVSLAGGGRIGRLVLARQRRPDEAQTTVQPWGISYLADGFGLRVRATDPLGRRRVKLETEACPAGAAFGNGLCQRHITPTWVQYPVSGVFFSPTISGLTTNKLYHWRTRVLYAPFRVTQPGITAPPQPEHGPWRRFMAKVLDGPDIRISNTPLAVDSHGPATVLAIQSLFPNPALGEVTVSFTLPSARTARLELYDIGGRRIVARELDHLGPGSHSIRLAEGDHFAPGVYMVRLLQGRESTIAKVVMIR
jgi:hypothetical protein